MKTEKKQKILWRVRLHPDSKFSCLLLFFTCSFLSHSCKLGYFLTLEGKLKMIDRINSGFLSAKFMDDYEPKDSVKLVRNLIVVAVLIKFGASIIGAIAGWFSGH